MGSYSRTQYGVWIIAALSAIASLVLALTLTAGEGNTQPFLLTVVVVWLLFVLLFGRLTVEVDDRAIRLAFGVGLVRREIPLERVQAVSEVRNSWWYGFGLRLTPRGWMWNIQGLDAIELEYGSGKHFRIGCAEPRELRRAIEGRLATGNS